VPKQQVVTGPFRHEPDEMVVALPHLNLLMQYLRNVLKVPPPSHTTSAELGLALVRFNTEKTLTQINIELAKHPEATDGATRQPPTEGLDRVLWGLRQLMQLENGFIPTLGKNRLVGLAEGVGWVIHGNTGTAVDDPKVLTGQPGVPSVRSAGPGAGVRVGILDTQLYAHPWLDGGWSGRYSDRLMRANPNFVEGHAAFVAGLILSQAPGAMIETRHLLGRKNTSNCWNAALGIVELGRSGLDVLNLSFACYTEDGEPPLALARAVDRLDPNLVVVAAAGNHGAVTQQRIGEDESLEAAQRRPAWPAALDDVIAVGAVDHSLAQVDFSPDAPWVDIHAVGKDVVSTYLPKVGRKSFLVDGGGWASWSGTSFASALVSGAVASAVDPGRVSGAEAMRDILGALDRSRKKDIGRTQAKALPLRLWGP